MTSVHVGFPSSGLITANFTASLAGLCLMSSDRYKIERVSTRIGCYVHANRNQLVETFLKTKNEWLLQLDPDLAFESDLIFRLLGVAKAKDAKVVAGWYMNAIQMGPAKTDIPLVFASQGDSLYMPFMPEGNQPVPADAVATGALMVHREVYEKTRRDSASPWFDFGTAGNGTLIGEDIFFCELVKKAGYEIWVDPKCKLRHFKMREVNGTREVQLRPSAAGPEQDGSSALGGDGTAGGSDQNKDNPEAILRVRVPDFEG